MSKRLTGRCTVVLVGLDEGNGVVFFLRILKTF